MKSLLKTEIDIASPRLQMDDVKKGASPGAIMRSEDGVLYMVKLGIPSQSSKFFISGLDVADELALGMSRKSCEEKGFFNIAEAIGNNKYEVPETSVVLLKPKEYSTTSSKRNNPKSLQSTLKNKIKLPISSHEIIQKEEVLEYLADSEILHFSSKMVDPYNNIGDFYRYHEDVPLESISKTCSALTEPKGIGAFFALSCCMGNNDCIGSSGSNAGFNVETGRVIVIDGGNSNPSPHMISKELAASDNNIAWLSFTASLSVEAQKEACDTFISFVNLTEVDLRNLITDNGKFSSVLGEDYVSSKVIQLQTQQKQVVKVFYDSMLDLNCRITPAVANIKRHLILEEEKETEMGSDKENITQDKQAHSPPRKKVIKKNIRSLGLSLNISQDNSVYSELAEVSSVMQELGVSKADATHKDPPSPSSSRVNAKRKSPVQL